MSKSTTVHLVPRPGLNFDPEEVGPVDVPEADVPALLATGAYIVTDPIPAPAPEADSPAVTAEKEADNGAA